MAMSEHYEFIKAFVEDGQLRWEYRVKGSAKVGRMSHDEDVSDFSDKDIVSLTRNMLDVEDDDPVEIEVIHG